MAAGTASAPKWPGMDPCRKLRVRGVLMMCPIRLGGRNRGLVWHMRRFRGWSRDAV